MQFIIRNMITNGLDNDTTTSDNEDTDLHNDENVLVNTHLRSQVHDDACKLQKQL